MQKTIIIGDIHGCFDELQALLDRVGPVAGDRIIAIGDIVDRGPLSERCLEFFLDTPGALSIMGNHERKHIRSARGETRPAASQLIVREELGERYAAWLEFMATFPRHLELPEAILVHGFFEPGIPLEQQRDNVVIGTLTGEKPMTDTYADPWYDHYCGPKPLVFGHHDYLRTGEPLIREGLLYGIDTGCSHGGRLTALVLPEFRIVQVPARRDYWTPTRRAFIARSASQTSEYDLEWEKLADIAATPIRPDMPAETRLLVERCFAAHEHALQLTDAVIERVRSCCQEIERELAAAADWPGCTAREQAARFAQAARASPASQLLFYARGGRLNRETVWRNIPNLRALLLLAPKLGIAVEPPPEESAAALKEDDA